MNAPVTVNFLEPLFAILTVVAPLGLAYVILLWQSRKPACGCREAPANARDDLLQNRAGLSCADDKHAAQ